MDDPREARLDRLWLGIALTGLTCGLALTLAGDASAGRLAWTAGIIPVLAALLAAIVRGLRAGEPGWTSSPPCP